MRFTFLMAVLALAACGGDSSSRTPRAAVAVGSPAPLYAATTMDGAPVSLSDYRESVVMLNVWATWCKPCREEIPALDSLYREYSSRGLVVTGVSIDVMDDTARIAGFARELGASYPLWLDPDDRVSGTFLAIGVPSTYLIDREGVLRWRHMGPVRANDPALRALLDSLLGAPLGGN